MRIFSAALITCLVSFSSIGMADEYSVAEMPEYLIQVASKAGVPTRLLYAMALQESRILVDDAWHISPYAVRLGATTRHFDDAASAVASIELFLGEGGKPLEVDFGVTQINLHYHEHFVAQHGLQHAIEPVNTLTYTTTLLSRCMRQGETMLECVGRHHNGRPIVAGRYMAAVARRLSELNAIKASR